MAAATEADDMIDLGDELADYDGKPEGPLPQEMRGYAHGMSSAGRLADLQAQGFNKEPPPEDMLPLGPDWSTLYSGGGGAGGGGNGGSSAPLLSNVVDHPWIIATENADGSITYRDTRHDKPYPDKGTDR